MRVGDTDITVGDILEWAAGAAFIAASYLSTHAAWPPVTTAGHVFAYEAQCYASHQAKRPHPFKWVRNHMRRRQA
jgi:hypothetical protein